jgi:hypothetical protein
MRVLVGKCPRVPVPRRRRCAPMVLGAHLLFAGSLLGCGAPAPEAPQPEQSNAGVSASEPAAPSAPQAATATTPPTALPRTGGPAPEPARRAAGSAPGTAQAATPPDPAPAVRTYLAEHYIYTPWYRNILSVEPMDHGVVVTLSPGADSKGTAQGICQAVLRSRYAGVADIRYSMTGSTTCP